MTQEICKSSVLKEAARIKEQFEAHGAISVEAATLLPAEMLLDLYGEDIRSRAYVTDDPVRGEIMLRPDFTVPVVKMHMDQGAAPARYTYSGLVYRKQSADPSRENEFIQVGYEVFDGTNLAAADAEVFSIFVKMLAGLNLRAAMGDIGILVAAVKGLQTTERRKNALLRHIWRPRRFKAMLERYSSKGEEARKQRYLRTLANQEEPKAPQIGLRSQAEIETRIAALKEDAQEKSISDTEIELLTDILTLRENLPNAVAVLRDIAVDLPAISDAVEQLSKRARAMQEQGIDLAMIDFEGSYGRTSMEYYDGFVFGFHSVDRSDLSPVATGGRYDALTSVLGQGSSIPAVGGVMRPDVVLRLQEALQ